MAQLQPHRASSAHDTREELREDPLATATFRARGFFEEYRTPITIAGAAILALIVIIGGWRWYQSNQDEKAAEQLGFILTEYEAGNLEAALEGSDEHPGLIEIADEYGSTDTGNLATFFAADALFQLGRFDEAATYYDQYDAGDDLLGASALAARGALAEQAGNWDEAGDLYLRAADVYPSVATTPDNLMSAARAFEFGGKLDEARQALQRLVDEDDWAETQELPQAQLTLARLNAMAEAGTTLEARPAPAAPPPPAPPTPALPGGMTIPGLQGGPAAPVQVVPSPAEEGARPAPTEAPADAPAETPAPTPAPAETAPAPAE